LLGCFLDQLVGTQRIDGRLVHHGLWLIYAGRPWRKRVVAEHVRRKQIFIVTRVLNIAHFVD